MYTFLILPGCKIFCHWNIGTT